MYLLESQSLPKTRRERRDHIRRRTKPPEMLLVHTQSSPSSTCTQFPRVQETDGPVRQSTHVSGSRMRGSNEAEHAQSFCACFLGAAWYAYDVNTYFLCRITNHSLLRTCIRNVLLHPPPCGSRTPERAEREFRSKSIISPICNKRADYIL